MRLSVAGVCSKKLVLGTLVRVRRSGSNFAGEPSMLSHGAFLHSRRAKNGSSPACKAFLENVLG